MKKIIITIMIISGSLFANGWGNENGGWENNQVEIDKCITMSKDYDNNKNYVSNKEEENKCLILLSNTDEEYLKSRGL